MEKKKRLNTVLISAVIFLLIGINPAAAAGSSDLAKFESAKEFFKKGLYYFNDMKYLAGVEFFRKAVAEYPGYYTAREYLARSYKLAGFIDEANKEWEILADMTANNVSIVNKIKTYSRDSAGSYGNPDKEFEFVFSNEYLPEDMGRYRVTDPVDIAVDSEKNLYISSFTSGKLVKLNPNGEGQAVLNLGSGNRFFGVDCWKNLVCLSDFKRDSVHILSSDLRIIKTFGTSGNEEGKFHGPEGVSFDDNGNIYVVDSGNNRVQKFDKDGNYILEFGKSGEYEGQLDRPSYILFHNNIVYISDTGNKRIACFDDSGNFIKNITVNGVETPRDINVYNNNLLISDEKNGLVFYNINDFKTSSFVSWDDNKKRFSRLISAEFDRDGTLYCLDYNRGSVYMFSPLYSRYTNLDIEITSIDTMKYPVVAVYLNARNKKGDPVYNLRSSNFLLTEDSAEIPDVYVDYLKNLDPSISAVLCVDRSYATRGYHNEIPWVSDFILQKMKKNDSVKVMNFHRDTWSHRGFDWSRRRTLDLLKTNKYAGEKDIGKALYNAISDLLPRTNKRGVILISDGSVTPESFKRYTPENIIDYARCHYIPVYVIVFKEKDPVLQKIAVETGGGMFRANELDGLRSIYTRIKESEEYRYVLLYSTLKSSSLKGWWSDIKIEVNLKGSAGVEWGGYFVP